MKGEGAVRVLKNAGRASFRYLLLSTAIPARSEDVGNIRVLYLLLHFADELAKPVLPLDVALRLYVLIRIGHHRDQQIDQHYHANQHVQRERYLPEH